MVRLLQTGATQIKSSRASAAETLLGTELSSAPSPDRGLQSALTAHWQGSASALVPGSRLVLVPLGTEHISHWQEQLLPPALINL